MIEKVIILIAFMIVAGLIFFLGYITGSIRQCQEFDNSLPDIRDECVKEIVDDLDRIEKEAKLKEMEDEKCT